MYLMREKWTDERLDDQKGRVDDLAQEMSAGFARLDERMDRMMLVLVTGFLGLAGLMLGLAGLVLKQV